MLGTMRDDAAAARQLITHSSSSAVSQHPVIAGALRIIRYGAAAHVSDTSYLIPDITPLPDKIHPDRIPLKIYRVAVGRNPPVIQTDTKNAICNIWADVSIW